MTMYKKNRREVILQVDLGFGDSGKGTILHYLTVSRNAHTIVRYNGAHQAAHTAVDEFGRSHTFSQFGSGMLRSGVRTFLSPQMLIEPIGMIIEEEKLRGHGIRDAFQRLFVHERCVITTPFHIAVNRLRELSLGDQRHGSCGLGVGETVTDILADRADLLYAKDLQSRATVVAKMRLLRNRKRDEIAKVLSSCAPSDAVRKEQAVLESGDRFESYVTWYLELGRRMRLASLQTLREFVQMPGTVLFEGAQGVLLDQRYGFYPHVTWSDTTLGNAHRLLAAVGYDGRVERMGVIRAYATRHGRGPFVSESITLTRLLPDVHNITHPWQGTFRIGWFDLPATRYALEAVGGIDTLSVTNLDRLESVALPWRVCEAYRISPEQDAKGLLAGQRPDGSFSKILFKKHPSLKRQERLADILWKATPEYRQVDRGEEKYLSLLEKELGVPVGLVSKGPMAKDKYVR